MYILYSLWIIVYEHTAYVSTAHIQINFCARERERYTLYWCTYTRTPWRTHIPYMRCVSLVVCVCVSLGTLGVRRRRRRRQRRQRWQYIRQSLDARASNITATIATTPVPPHTHTHTQPLPVPLVPALLLLPSSSSVRGRLISPGWVFWQRMVGCVLCERCLWCYPPYHTNRTCMLLLYGQCGWRGEELGETRGEVFGCEVRPPAVST